MIDRDIVIDIRTIVSYSGPFNTPVYSAEHKVYGVVKDAGAEEKNRASASGRVNLLRVDINEEEFDDETITFIDTSIKKEIYKTARVKNKVYLYLSDEKTGGD